jgi:radical SAM superfamily enzyme YgiQ (UPF0313 family)
VTGREDVDAHPLTNVQRGRSMSTSVYLADLRYNYMGVLANDCMPLGTAYMKAVIERDLPEVQSNLFAYPDRLWDALSTAPPDILMLSNYCWNESLSLHFASLAKRLRPDILVIMGGPNIPLEVERQIAYLADHPEIDLYILGEGDFLAAQVTRMFLDRGKSISSLLGSEIPSSIYRQPDGSVVVQKKEERLRDIDDIPSPWLAGVQDEFFDGKLAPMIETNRGCPFTCTFCVQGARCYAKVHNYDLDRIKSELEYIARKIKAASPAMGTLRIADSNYGMFERDIEISDFIGRLQREYAWPTYIDATTGKNRPDRIIKSVEKVNGALLFTQAIQSMDEHVLENVRRSTIKLEAYEQIHTYMHKRGLRSNTDLILGLPGETLHTHLAAIHKLLNAEFNQVHNFQLMMLKGSDLETMESRKMFSFETRFRVLPKNVGVYGGKKVFDIEEIVVATDTLSFEDYLRARQYHLTSSVFQNDGWFDDVLRFAAQFGVKPSEWWDAMHEGLETSSGIVRKFVDDFARDEKNFSKLISGEIGDNLMYKYRAIASFHIWPEICRLAMDQTNALLVSRGIESHIPEFREFWGDFHRFEEHKHASGATVESILSPSDCHLLYDIPRWLADGMPADVRPYRRQNRVHVEFRLSDNGAQELEAALQVWSSALKGLSKLVTRIQVECQVRHCHIKDPSPPESRSAS